MCTNAATERAKTEDASSWPYLDFNGEQNYIVRKKQPGKRFDHIYTFQCTPGKRFDPIRSSIRITGHVPEYVRLQEGGFALIINATTFSFHFGSVLRFCGGGTAGE